jgi:WD40 repeat protein
MTAGASPLLFVSYTPADEDWASWIAWELESAGYRVVLQAWDFVPGTNFVDFMDRGVAGAAAVIAVLSRSYLSSRFGRWEWQTAILADPDDPEAKLITVRVEECPLEGLLSTITYVDLVSVQDQHEARNRVLTRVGQTLAGRAKPGTAPAFPPAATAAQTAAVPVEIMPVGIEPAETGPDPASQPERQQREHPRRRPATRPEYPPAHQESEPLRDGVAILHVPGPRFGRGLPEEGVPATATELQARIWADVNRLVDAGAPRPDLFVVSGDLTESGSLREFDEAITFLAGLRALLGLEPDRCVIVPGSHDITRRACEAYFADCEADDIEPRSPYWPKWRHFSRIFDELYRDMEGLIFDRSQPWTFFAVPDLRVVVVGLNSTMAESHRPEDRYGSVGEAQAAWFAERLRPYADDGWLRLAAVAHDPAVMRDAAATGQLLGTRINVLLHGASGKDPNLFSRTSVASSPWLPSSSAVGDGPPDDSVLVVPAGAAGQHEILHLTADGMTRWRPDDKSPQRSARRWRSATATFPPPPEPEGQPEAKAAGAPGDDLAALAAGRDDPDEVSGRAASPTLQLLDQVAEVVEAGRPGAKLRRATADSPPHLLVTHAEDGFVRQWRVAAHAGKVTREVIDEFAAVIHSGEQESGAELIYSGPRAPQVLRAEALRRGIRVRSFTEFQGLLDLRDYVAGQATRLQADQRYPHPLYVPQRFRDLESASGSAGDDLVAELLRELAVDTGRFILLLADFGRGKTFALRELARHIPARLPYLIPIYVELRELDKAHSVDGLVAAHLANHGEDVIDLKAFRYMLQQGRIVLLFDGFDELATRVTFDRAADHLQTLLAAAEGRAKVIVASRTQHFKSDTQVFTALGERVGLLPGRRVLGIEDFGEDQIRAYLRNWYGEERKASERLRLISGIEDLLGLSSNPRMLSFIAQLDERRLRAVASAGRTLSGADLYREILDTWLAYERDRVQDIPGAPAGLTLADLWRAVTVLAMRLNESGESLIRLDALTAEAATSLAGLASGQLTAQQSVHAIGAGSLLVRSEAGMFGFIHSSVAEWLVANEIAERLGTGTSGDGPAGDGAADYGADAVGVLARRVLAQLTIDFLCDLADPLALRAWMSGVLKDPRASDASRTNALRVSARLRVPAKTDLRGASLQGEDLSHRELGQVDFTGADLTGARLVGSNLSGAVLAGARLNGARLNGTRMSGADLRGADLCGARLTRTDLTGARLEGSQWNRAALIDVAGLPAAGSAPELRGAAIAPGQQVEIEIAPADIGVPYGYHYQTARLPQPLSYSSDGSLLAVGNSDGGVTLCDTATGLPVRTLRGHSGRVYGVAYAAGDRVLVTVASDAALRLWDTATGECTRVIEVSAPGAWPAEVSPDGRVMAYGSPDGVVRLLDVESGRTLAELPGHATPVYTVAFGTGAFGTRASGTGASGRADESRAVITGDRAGAIRIWDQATGSLLAQFSAGHGGPVYRLLARPGGTTMFAAGGESGTLLLLDARGLVAADLTGHTGAVYALDFSPVQPLLASGCTDGGVRLWDVSTQSQRAVLSPHPGAIYGLSFSPDGSLLASASNDGLVRITSVADGWVRHELTAHRSAVWRPVFSPDGAQLATGSNDSTCRLWDTASGQPRHVLRGHGRRATSVTFSADGAMLAAGGNDGMVRVWDPVTGQQRHALTGAADRLVSAVFGPVPALLAAASNDGGVYLWNAVTGIYEQEMNVETERVWAETFSPDGEVLATANDDDSVRLWYRTTGRNILTLTEHKGRVRSLAFSPSGDLLATGCDDRGVRVWDTAVGALRAWMHGHTDRVYAVAFSPTGDLLASVGNDGVGYLWDPDDGTQVRRIEPGGGKLWTTAFSPSGDMIATAGDDGVIRLWSVPDGVLLHALTGHADRVAAVAFSPSGEFLASAADDGTVRVWSLPAGAGADGPALRVTLLGAEGGWAAFSPDGRYKLDGTIAGQFWHVIGSCRFEPGELDPYLPAIQRLPADAPF